MHQLIAALFTLLFSASHVTTGPAANAWASPSATGTVAFRSLAPSRQELMEADRAERMDGGETNGGATGYSGSRNGYGAEAGCARCAGADWMPRAR